MTILDVDGAAVEAAIRDVVAAEVSPRFRALRDDEVFEKAPGDLVTAADRGCEHALTGRLRELLDIPVVGEEATARRPELLEQVASSPVVWVLDPVDGTSNFVAGSADHAVIVALVEAGRTVGSWMLLPVSGVTMSATLGGGAWRDGTRATASPPRPGVVGMLKRGYLPEPVRAASGKGSSVLQEAVQGRGCCPVDYDDVVTGDAAFAIYWRTLPWDHAGPALYAAEAGLRVRRPGGATYEPGDGGVGLVVAHPDVWDAVDEAFGALL